jgi:hypothetical protein
MILLEQKRWKEIDPSKHLSILTDKNILSCAEVATNSGLLTRFVWLLENPNKTLIDSDYHREPTHSLPNFHKHIEVKPHFRSNSNYSSESRKPFSLPVTARQKFKKRTLKMSLLGIE